MPQSVPKSPQAGRGLESTAALLGRVRHGDEAARDDLALRYYQVLRRFAHGRLPRSSRGMTETDDLVQITVMRALKHLDHFEPKREGAFLAYLRRILINEVRDEMRRVSRAPTLEPISDSLGGHQPSPIEELVGKERLERFETALSELGDREKEAVILRVELGLAHQEIADALGIRTAHAARMYVSRAIAKLAERMRALGATHEVT